MHGAVIYPAHKSRPRFTTPRSRQKAWCCWLAAIALCLLVLSHTRRRAPRFVSSKRQGSTLNPIKVASFHNSNSCNQPSISSLNCDVVQRHPNGSFTSSSRWPCPLRHLSAAVLLLQPSSHAYFHFMFETLPRLQLALPWMRRHTNCSILVDAWHGNSWSLQALDLLGFGGAVVVRQAHVRYSVAIGFIPPAPPIHHTFPAELNATVQQLLLAADAAAGIHGDGSVLFIQRSSSESQHSVIHSGDCPNGVRMREILNMKEVETALRSRFGSRLLIFRSHGLNLTQQIKAFRRARMVIGVHGSFAMHVLLLPRGLTQHAGAGLVNTMFCVQGTPVIEILPQVRHNCAHATSRSFPCRSTCCQLQCRSFSTAWPLP